MEKSLLERLSYERPCGRGGSKNRTLSGVREFIKRHEQEIEEARACNYSWKQIDSAVRELYGDTDDLLKNIHWWENDALLIEDMYGLMRRNRNRKA